VTSSALKAPAVISPGQRPADFNIYDFNIYNDLQPCKGGRCDCSVPQVAFIKFELLEPEQRPELILKCSRAMMFVLLSNISDGAGQPSLSNRKCAIACLPVKSSKFSALAFQPL
jgi:hypothetical protein